MFYNCIIVTTKKNYIYIWKLNKVLTVEDVNVLWIQYVDIIEFSIINSTILMI